METTFKKMKKLTSFEEHLINIMGKKETLKEKSLRMIR
jgi:hypothetical protein